MDLSGVYSTSSSGGWSRAWLDLTPYAGQRVLLGLYFTSPGGGQSSGWYVDELAIETGTETGLSFPEGFENGWGGWKAQYFGGLATDWAIWEIGTPTPSSGPGAAHGGTNCAATVLSGNYPVGRTSRLVSPAFEVPGAGLNPQLRFWHWWSFNSSDYGKVQVSTNNGVSWLDLSPVYTGSSGTWTQPQISLSTYGSQIVRLGLLFASPGGGSSSGWYVDDIALLATGYQPMITAQPTNVTVVVGSPASFFVALNPISTTPLSYQWRFNGSPIPGATDATYTIGSAQTNHQGGYEVIITNIHGAATSVPPAMLTVIEPVIITTQPQSQTVGVGADVAFTVEAAGTGPLGYQWRSNGVPITGATAPSLFLPNVQLTQSGSIYSVVVSNAANSTNSADALLTVVPDCAAFVSHDVGDVSMAGGFSQSNCVFTIWGNGEDIEDTADAFHFVHQPLTGDGQIIANLLGIQGTDTGAEAGLMMRESLNVGARHVFVALSAGKNVAFRRRLALNAYSVDTRFQATNSAWLRLMRMGNTFVAHYSTNGHNWDYVWFTTLDLPSQLEVGLAVTAHSYGQMATGHFDNVSLGGLAPIEPWMQPGSRIYLGGEAGGMAEFQRVGGFKALAAGSVGERYTVWVSPEVSAPFATWLKLGTVTNVYGVVPLTDAGALTNGNRFYRLQRIEP